MPASPVVDTHASPVARCLEVWRRRAMRYGRVALWLAMALALPAHAQRVALLIGNAAYPMGRLSNPPNDVQVMESALAKLGFKVQKVLNANQNQMKRAVRDFGTAAQGAEVALMYYSGHGTQANGENYLLPVGANIEKESDYEVEAVSANAVLRQIQGARPKAAILVLDACRDNPLAATTRSATKGLGRMEAPAGTLIAFATAPNTVASDNGDYARVLARELQKSGQELLDVFRNTTAEVRRLSDGKQEPRISEMSLTDRLYLAGRRGTQVASVTPEPTGVPVQADPEQEAWEAAKRTHTPSSYQAYLRRYPGGRYAVSARVALEGLQPASASTAAQPARITPPAPASSRPPTPPSTAPTLGGRYQILARGAEVKDLSTGLVWQRCSVGQSWDGQTCAGQAQRFSFGEAQALGRNGWRVPGKEELDSLVDQQAGRPTIHAQAFPATSAYWYWSSTPYAGRASDARVVYFGNSLIYRDHRSGTYPVRLVR